jgi:hypothetical protein
LLLPLPVAYYDGTLKLPLLPVDDIIDLLLLLQQLSLILPMRLLMLAANDAANAGC